MVIRGMGSMRESGGVRLGAMRLRAALAGMAAVMALAGCGSKDEGRVEVFPVTGKVLVNGQPAAGAEVIFLGATPDLQGPGTISASGIANEQGVFQLGSYAMDDGAPAGKFNVAVIWREPIPEGVDRERFEAKDRLSNRYATAEASGLSAEVPPGGVELPPFELK